MTQPQGHQRMMQDQEPSTGLALSLIIPAYNESQRLPPYLESIREYIHRQYADECEVIVVDDGSSDQLADALDGMAAEWKCLKIIRHERNLGKGAAVRTGVLAARGDRVLYADADGATPIDQELKLREAIDAGADLAVGSRLVDAGGAERKRTYLRALIGRAFAALAHSVLKPPVRDTQCGFKMLRAEPAQRLFGLSQEDGYLFDLEILVLAEQCGYRVMEVPINWSDRPGGQLKPLRDCGGILMDLWRVRRRLGVMR